MAEPGVGPPAQSAQEMEAEAETGGSMHGAPKEAALESGVDSEMRLRGLVHDVRNATGFVSQSASQLRRYVDDLLEMIGFFDELAAGLGEREQELLREFKALVPVDVATEEIPRVMDTIREGERRIVAILEQLRPPAAGGPAAQSGDSDLVLATETALGVFSSTHGALVQFTSELETSPRVACDELAVARLLDNLLLNAVKAVTEKADPGHVHVSVGPLQSEKAVELVVRDDGVGMAPEVKDRVFQPYFTTRGGQGGTGLGLAVVQQVVDGCGGQIRVESSPGQGTAFFVELPVVAAGGGGE